MSLDLPGNAASFSSRLKPARSGSTTTEGSRPGLLATSDESRGGEGVGRSRGSGDDGKAEGGSEGGVGHATAGVSKRDRRGNEDLGEEEEGADGVPKVILLGRLVSRS